LNGTGLFCSVRQGNEMQLREAPEMVHRKELAPPRGRESLDVLRSGREGVWWERADGLQVRVAAPEREPVVERTRLSLFAMVLAYAVAERSPR
jgi:hypothetical protein